MSVKFGVAGNSDTFTQTVSKASADAPKWLRSIGLDCYEYQCGKGVHVGEATARKVGENAAEAEIGLSLHAPYFISLSNPDPEMLVKTTKYVTDSCMVAAWMGATRVVVHSGALMKRTRREALEIAKSSMGHIINVCDEMGYGDIALCPETMGKINQLGDLDEVLELCSLDERLIPCVDFGHLYARSLGELNGPEACRLLLDKMANALGEDRAKQFHSHFSKIEFSLNGGEKKHLRFQDEGWGPAFEPLLEELYRRSWSPTIICESSGTQSEDALTMKYYYETLRKEAKR